MKYLLTVLALLITTASYAQNEPWDYFSPKYSFNNSWNTNQILVQAHVNGANWLKFNIGYGTNNSYGDNIVLGIGAEKDFKSPKLFGISLLPFDIKPVFEANTNFNFGTNYIGEPNLFSSGTSYGSSLDLSAGAGLRWGMFTVTSSYHYFISKLNRHYWSPVGIALRF